MNTKFLTALFFSCFAAVLTAQDTKNVVKFENNYFLVTAQHAQENVLQNDSAAFANRGYVFKDVQKPFSGVKIIRTFGGENPEIVVTLKEDATLIFLTADVGSGDLPKDWLPLRDSVCWYNDAGKTLLRAFFRISKKGEIVTIPEVNWHGSMLLLPEDPHVFDAVPRPKYEIVRMEYRNPGLLDDLAVGLRSFPAVFDINEDGNPDFLVSTGDVPYNQTVLFENLGVSESRKGVGNPYGSSNPVENAKMPVFRRVPGKVSSQFGFTASVVDGKCRLLTPGCEYTDPVHSGNRETKPVPFDASKITAGKSVRANQWAYTDFDGDGRTDLLIGLGDWKEYGWADAYDENGNWTNGPLHGTVYIVRNEGSNEEPAYKTAEQLSDCNGKVVDTFGWPTPQMADFDGDGDLDLMCGEFIDKYNYYENVGTRTEPKFAPQQFVTLENGEMARLDMEFGPFFVCDWTKDGFPDLIAGDEGGYVMLFEHTGTFRDVEKDGVKSRVPVFRAPLKFQQEAFEMKLASLCTPCAYDWDGDGDTDLVCGCGSGYVAWFENLSGSGVEFPKWDRPKYLEADGKVIHIIAGPNGSIQGPAEEKWGYTTLTVGDWDGDGDADVLINSIWGKVGWYENVGTRTAPKLTAWKAVEVEWEGPQPTLAWGWLRPNGKELLTQWRTTPVMCDWNRDGLQDLMMLDTEGYLAYFERYKDADGTLRLKSPKRLFTDANGLPIRLNGGTDGGSGRRKICVCDWNGDGLMDFVVNSVNAEVWLQLEPSSDGKLRFKRCGNVDDTRLAGHTSSPTPVDFNADGKPDLVIGAEDGFLYYYRHE